MKVIETEIEGLEGVGTDVGWLVRGGIAAGFDFSAEGSHKTLCVLCVSAPLR